MSLFVIPVILLGLPALEALVMVWLAGEIGWWLAVWLLADAVAGLLLVRAERLAVAGRIVAALTGGRDPLRELLFSARLLLAGLLLAFPGVISDLLALLVMLWPRRRGRPAASAPRVIEGQAWRED